MLRRIGIAFFCFFCSAAAQAFSFDSARSIYLGAGVLSPNAGRVASQASGAKSMVGDLLPQVTLSGRLDLGSRGSDWTLVPSIGYTPFPKRTPEGGAGTTYLPILLTLSRSYGSFDLKFGPGVLFRTISGSGGTTQLSNGTGTSTFGLPEGSSTARVFVVDLGFGVVFDSFRLDVDGLVTGVASSRRAVNLQAALSYGLF